MDMSVLRYLIWLLIIWLLRNTARTAWQQTTFFSDVYAPRAGIWQGREREFWVREADEEGGRDFNIRQVDVYNAKNNSLLTGISLPSFPFVTLVPKPPFPFEMPATQAKWCKSTCLRCLTFKRFAYFTIFWGLEVKYILLDHGMYLW